MEVYALKNKNDSIRECSSSGGVFYLLAKDILNNGGIVYGAGYNETFSVEHIRISSCNNLNRILGAKYVQSKIGDSYYKIKKDLVNGKTVLFSGTPCQVQGLCNFLGHLKNSKSLFLCDIICHGVPSPSLFQKYIKNIEKRTKKKIVKICFREKKIYKWKDCMEIAFLENGEKFMMKGWMRLFYGHEILRKSCYKCPFTNLERVGDITLGDFWGIEHCNFSFYDEKGVSLVLINSKEGKQLFQNIVNSADVIEEKIENANQPQLYKPVRKPFLRNLFWRIYKRKGFEYILSMVENERGIYNGIINSSVKIKSFIKTSRNLLKHN